MMRQLNFLDTEKKESPQLCNIDIWELFVDGASRNNPGLAGVGIVILKNDKSLKNYGFFVGCKTNNQAEYLALIIGLLKLKQLMAADDKLIINSDSELVVKHIKGLYKVKNELLKPLYNVTMDLLKDLVYDINHVVREKNKKADALANKGVDTKTPVSDDLLKALHEYEISL